MPMIQIGVLAVVGLLCFANSRADAQTVRGTIKSAAPDAITIEGYVITIVKETKIFVRDGTDRKAATGKDLKVGQRVEILFNGGIQKSDPAQGVAAEIVIASDNDPDMRGVITKISTVKGLHGMVLIEEKDGQPYEEIWVRVTKDTKIFKLDGKDRKAATFEDLTVGVRVETRSNGKISDSDPPQTTAIEIVILPAAKK